MRGLTLVRALRGAAAAALLALIGGWPLVAHAQDRDEREAPRVVKLSFQGNESFRKGDLEDAIHTQASRCKSILVAPFCLFSKSPLWYNREYLDRTEFQRDVLRLRVFYWRRGYRDAQVDTVVAKRDEGVAITFRIAEGPPTRVSSIVVRQVGDTAVLSDRDIARQMQLRAGDPYDILAVDSSIVLLRDLLANRGFSDAVVRSDTAIVDTARKTAALRLEVNPRWLARVGEIDISGNERITDRTIRNSIALKPGHIYRRDEVLLSQRRLYESNLFRHAAIVIPPRGDSVKTIEVNVREAPFNEVRTSVGFNTVDFLQAEQRYTRYNFLGGARRLDLRAVVGNILAPQLNGSGIFQDVVGGVGDLQRDRFLRPTWQLSADFTQPWLHSPRNSFGAGLFAHRRAIPGVVVDKGYGATISFTRQLAERAPASLSYHFEMAVVDAGDVYYCINFGVCERRTIDALRGSRRLSPVALSFFTDRSNSLMNPTTGYTARLDLEHASGFTASDFRYNRVSGEVTKYWGITRTGTLAARVRGGWVRSLASTGAVFDVGATNAIIHPRKRFYAGGAQSVRGFGENQLGPLVLTLDPTKLGDSLSTCLDASQAAACSRILAALAPDDFQPRPTGGTALVEGSAEYRFPLWRELGGAVFLDGAFVGSGALKDVAKGSGALTPGVGVRYYSPAGAIRVDVGWRPKLTEALQVITQVTDPATGSTRIVQLAAPKLFTPVQTFLDHLTLHLSIGQAF
ncbi:MAG TPA: BamA/TamA family outer membrane protein [Gemmatimonadaceae bacterium]|nr:BamA/TamA family outer membrane protein [Gemmatimonadaceae bacterium]